MQCKRESRSTPTRIPMKSGCGGCSTVTRTQNLQPWTTWPGDQTAMCATDLQGSPRISTDTVGHGSSQIYTDLIGVLSRHSSLTVDVSVRERVTRSCAGRRPAWGDELRGSQRRVHLNSTRTRLWLPRCSSPQRAMRATTTRLTPPPPSIRVNPCRSVANVIRGDPWLT
jgi:hypothetical protein